MTNIARECEVKRKTVENYIEILEELLLAYRLPVFTKRAQRELSAHPKFYFFDAGVFRALRPTGFLDHSEEIEGLALEGLVAQHLMAWNDYGKNNNNIAFWRTRAGVEVDFIVYGPEDFWAIELKHATRVFPNDLKPIEAFLEDYPMARGLLLHRGKEVFLEKNILCVPAESFLCHLVPGRSINEVVKGLGS